MQITQREYKRRRDDLMAQMGENSIALLPAAPLLTRNRDVEHAFRQDSDFHYLSGFGEPEAVIVLKPGREHGEFIMFCRERDPAKELWTGLITGQEGVREQYGVDDAFPITDINDILPGLLEGCDRVYSSIGSHPEFDRQVIEWVNVIRAQVRNGSQPPSEFLVLDHLLHDMRLIKSKKEAEMMAESGRISAEGHVVAMKACRPGMQEYQLEAVYINHFMNQGCRLQAYPSIVGGGANACILHYTNNDQPLQDGDLVLVDAGAEYGLYAGDITRTFPVNGTFSAAQRALYDVVLAAQLAAIAEVKPGNHWNQPHEAAVKVLTAGLVELGILTGEVDTLIKDEAYKPFYMHKTGHWLGLDVHDVGEYKVGDAWRLLEPGMALTVEPGLYIAPTAKGVAKKWRGIGIRIEDDLLVTKEGCQVLTADVPKQADEIEQLMA
jgi:Xaa-Pro aminopeptidase